jgi:hypothetical protein
MSLMQQYLNVSIAGDSILQAVQGNRSSAMNSDYIKRIDLVEIKI